MIKSMLTIKAYLRPIKNLQKKFRKTENPPASFLFLCV